MGRASDTAMQARQLERATVPEQQWLNAYSTAQKEALTAQVTAPPWTGLRFLKGQRVMYCADDQRRTPLDLQSSAHGAGWESGRVVSCWLKVYPPAGVARRYRSEGGVGSFRERSRSAPSPKAKRTRGKDTHTQHSSSDEGAETDHEPPLGAEPRQITNHRWAPYQIMLDSGSMAIALRDDERSVRQLAPGEGRRVSAVRKRHLLSAWRAAPSALLRVGEADQASLTAAHMVDRLDRGNLAVVEVRPEEWHASVLRSDIRDDMWKMFKLASVGGNALDLNAVLPLFRSVEPGITLPEIEERFARMDEDGSGDIDFDEMQRLWWSCVLQGRELEQLEALSTDALEKASETLAHTVQGVKAWRSDRASLNISANLLTVAFKGRIVQSLQKHHDAAVFVQTRWRQKTASRYFRKLRHSCIRVQRNFRQSRFFRRFRAHSKQELQLVKQWSRRSIDVSSLLPPPISVPQSDADADSECEESSSIYLKGCFSEAISAEKHEESQNTIQSEKALRALLLSLFGEISMVRRYFTTERWHEVTASGKYEGRWPVGAAVESDVLGQSGFAGASREFYAVVCFHEPSVVAMALSSTGEQFASAHGLRFSPVVAEWTAPRQLGYDMAARATREHVKKLLDDKEAAKQRRQQTQQRQRTETMDARARLFGSAAPAQEGSVPISPRQRGSGDGGTDRLTPALPSAEAVLGTTAEERSAMAAWWTSVVAVHTGVLGSSASRRHGNGNGRLSGADADGIETSTPYTAMQREMAAATKRLRRQRVGRARQPTTTAGHASDTTAKKHSADGVTELAAAVVGTPAHGTPRAGSEGARHRHSSRFTAMEAQPAGQLLPQWADPAKLEAARTEHGYRQATLGALAAAHSLPTADTKIQVCVSNRRQVYLKAEAVAAQLVRTQAQGHIKSAVQRSANHTHTLEQRLTAALSLALWLKGINAPAVKTPPKCRSLPLASVCVCARACVRVSHVLYAY